MRAPVAAISSLALITTLALAPASGWAQMRTFEQSMGRLKATHAAFDGTKLNITTYKELAAAASFIKTYKANLQQAIGAWNKLMKSARTQARLKELQQRQNYFKALVKAFQEQARVIKPPVKAAPKPVKQITPDEIYVGPDAGKDTPYLLDTHGREQTLFRAWGSPGTKSKPSRWSAKLRFWVRYKGVNNGDVVQIQVLKGRKRLGRPTPCNPTRVISDAGLVMFDCKAPATRDWKGLFSTAGAHTIKLTYKKPVEGKVFKDFATLRVNVKQLKKGASNNPVVAWGEDHDAKLNVSTVEEAVTSAGRDAAGYTIASIRAALRQDIPFLVIRTWFKRVKRLGRTSMACMYKGKRVAEGRATSGQNYSYWSYKRKGSPARDDARWTHASYQIGMLKPRPGPRGKGSWSSPPHWLNENPGEYKCVILGGGEVLKEFYFTVGADGVIQKPACQLKSVNTLSIVTLLRTKDKKLSDRSYDKKAGNRVGFEGRVKWSRGCPPR